MVRFDVVDLPGNLKPGEVAGRAVVVFDVLRATTSIVTALSSGAKEVRIFGSLDAASSAAAATPAPKLLCGERNCLRPEGFDLGNSPADFADARVKDATLLLSTTNGTRAILAARGAAVVLAAALVNAAATARYLAALGRDVILLCAGTNGKPAPEDQLGAGAILHELPPIPAALSDSATAAMDAYRQARADLIDFLLDTDGGRNVVNAGLAADIEFAAQVNRYDSVIEITADPPVARLRAGPCL